MVSQIGAKESSPIAKKLDSKRSVRIKVYSSENIDKTTNDMQSLSKVLALPKSKPSK